MTAPSPRRSLKVGLALGACALALGSVGGSASRGQDGERAGERAAPPQRPVENRSVGLSPGTSGGPARRDPVATTAPRPRTDGQDPELPARSASEDSLAALEHPLSLEEKSALEALARGLSGLSLHSRERAATAIRERFGARAAGALLELSQRERDPERRFRERALVASLVLVPYAAHAHDCGWLGVRWTMSRTADRSFTVHIVEPLRGEPAALGGVRADDEILSWDGTALDGQDDFVDRVQVAAPDSTVTLVVERKVPVTIAGKATDERRQVPLKIVMGRRAESARSADLDWYHRDLAARHATRWLEAWHRLRVVGRD